MHRHTLPDCVFSSLENKNLFFAHSSSRSGREGQSYSHWGHDTHRKYLIILLSCVYQVLIAIYHLLLEMYSDYIKHTMPCLQIVNNNKKTSVLTTLKKKIYIYNVVQAHNLVLVFFMRVGMTAFVLQHVRT